MNRRNATALAATAHGCLLTASLILLALNLAKGHPRGAIYALLAVTAFGLLLAVDIREHRATRPQVPLDNRPPLWRRVLAGLLGVNPTRDKH